MSTGLLLATVPIKDDGGRSVAAVADLLLALFRFRDFNVGTIMQLHPERGPATVQALRRLAAGPPRAAPGTAAIAADALRLVDQQLSAARDVRERALKRDRDRARSGY